MVKDDLRKEEDKAGPWAMVSKKDAAHLQILTACACLEEGNWVSAITLAGAAEGQIKDVEHEVPDMFARIKKFEYRKRFKTEREYIAFVNRRRDWLKHNSNQKDMLFYEREAIAMVARAVFKYWLVYRDNADEIREFANWAKDKGVGRGVIW